MGTVRDIVDLGSTVLMRTKTQRVSPPMVFIRTMKDKSLADEPAKVLHPADDH